MLKVFTTFDFYGASRIFYSNSSFRNISWLHGWIFSDIKFPEQLIEPTDAIAKYHFVWTESQAEYLRQCGYRNIHAVGSPFLYQLQKRNYPISVGNIVSIFPPHSISKKNDRLDILVYLDKFRKIQSVSNLSHQVVLNSVDYNNQKLIDRIKHFGFKVIKGADVTDYQSFDRLIDIFLKSKSIVTPVLGSHIVYALACGVRVDFDMDNLIKYEMTEYKNHPYILDDKLFRAISAEVGFLKDSNIARLVSNFDTKPIDLSRSWALQQLGIDFLKDSESIREIVSDSHKWYLLYIFKKYFYRLKVLVGIKKLINSKIGK